MTPEQQLAQALAAIEKELRSPVLSWPLLRHAIVAARGRALNVAAAQSLAVYPYQR